MTHSDPLSLGPPVARAVTLTAFEQAAALFSSWDGRLEQISGGPFKGTLRVVRGRRVRLMRVESNQRVLIRGHDTAGLFSAYPVTAGCAGDLWQGHRFDTGSIVTNGPQAEIDHCSSRRTESVGVGVRPEVLADAARVLLNGEGANVPTAWAAFAPAPAAFGELTQRLSGLMALGLSTPGALGTAEGDRLEQECVRVLVAALFPPATGRVELLSHARARLLRRAEDLMRARLTEPVGAIDLCRELGASDRTLRLAFNERYGLGPMVFYKCLRLNAVRDRLRAEPSAGIAAVAGDYGFEHQGNFAADYRRLFGERPSDTVRTALGE
jgi:AraC family ethanolamine operon transcriptional activator